MGSWAELSLALPHRSSLRAFSSLPRTPPSRCRPFRPEIAWTQIQWIVLAYLAVLVVAEVIVLVRATRREAFQALRLGDEE